MDDLLMTPEEARATQTRAAISMGSRRTTEENSYHGNVVNLCNDWLRLSEYCADLRARLERAERAIDNALNALQDPNAEYLKRGLFCLNAIEILRAWKDGKNG